MIRWKSSSDFCSQILSREKQEKRAAFGFGGVQ